VANPVASHRLAACADIRHPRLAAVLHADEDEWILFFGGAVLIATSVVVVLSVMDGTRENTQMASYGAARRISH